MSVRSDLSLDLQLKRVLDTAVHPEVKAALASARTHMNKGSGGHRRGGQVLVQLLEAVRSRAADVGEWQVVRLVQDSLDYAEGRILQPDLNDRYRLFQDGVRNTNLQRGVGNVLRIGFTFAAETSREYADANPEAGADDLIAYFGSLVRCP